MKQTVFWIGHIIVIGIISYYTFVFLGIDNLLTNLERFQYDIVWMLDSLVGGETILAIIKLWFVWLIAHIIVSAIQKSSNKKQEDNVN